ncbi:hypothetical protein B0H10DRAFT_1957123 [Mycena sp. CBHHK59/15]|nr:hypothetical protein B0H10DRAFT_1957123 [Mycena sp. CBHHK59/15]
MESVDGSNRITLDRGILENLVDFLKRLQPKTSDEFRREIAVPAPLPIVMKPDKHNAGSTSSERTPLILLTAFRDLMQNCTSLSPQDQTPFLNQQIDSLTRYLVQSSDDCSVSDPSCTHADTVEESRYEKQKQLTEDAIELGKLRNILTRERRAFEEEKRVLELKEVLRELGDV